VSRSDLPDQQFHDRSVVVPGLTSGNRVDSFHAPIWKSHARILRDGFLQTLSKQGIFPVVDVSCETDSPDALFIVRKQTEGYPDIFDSVDRMVEGGKLRSGAALEFPPGASLQASSEFWRRVIEQVRRRGTEIVVLHHFHSDRLPDISHHLEELKALSHRPVIGITNGDAFFRGFFRPSFPTSFLDTARSADAIFTTSMGVSGDYLKRQTDNRISLLPNGVCQHRFDVRQLGAGSTTRPDFKVVVIGSNNRSQRPWSPYFWYGRKRARLVNELTKKFGSEFAVFGKNWEGFPSWRGAVGFSKQQRVCRSAQVVVGGIPYSPARYYTSDRPFIQIASGVPFVDLRVDGIETILRDGEHWHLADSIDRIIDVCDELLARPHSERVEQGIAAAEYVLTHHRVVDRCQSVVASLSGLRRAIIVGTAPPAPDLSHFLPSVDIADELPLATRNWI